METIIRLKNLTKKYKIDGQELVALKDINLNLKKGSFVTVVGKSGCGKSTLLRIIAGLEKCSQGEIMGAEKIKISLVFQEARLMPWLTVAENILFPLKNKENKIKARKKINQCLNLLGLNNFRDAYPNQISGGMAQRTALGRALVYDSDLILMDEPLGSLDAFNRYKLQEELEKIFAKSDKTVIFVTHDIDEAIYLGDRVLIMDQGALVEEFTLSEASKDMQNKKYYSLKEKILKKIKS